MSKRDELAAALESALGEGWVVKDHPADLTALPAAVVAAGDPWAQPIRKASGAATGFEWLYDVELSVKRTTVADGIEALEAAHAAIVAAVSALGWRWVSFEYEGQATISKVPAVLAKLTIAIREVT